MFIKKKIWDNISLLQIVFKQIIVEKKIDCIY